MIDTHYSFETPEGVELDLNIAGPVIRGWAYLIDIAVRIVLQVILAIILGVVGKIGTAILLVSFFILEWFYPVFFEVFRRGQTPGKKTMGIKVVHDNGTPIGWGSSIIRNLLRAADFLPLMYMMGLVSMTVSRKFQRLGDIASGALVVYADVAFHPPDIPEETPKKFPIALSLEEQQAFIALAERSSLLSEDRMRELANILTDVTGERDETAVRNIFKVANSIIGVK